ncbi:hypothetical protein [Actinomadura latina]|uniref:hypothetical protein n=1 Tax=Actinomadura latina TaxID=163603 RepID=UPI000A4214CF|nr:hypothetical protein [Actinomadura latina]
MSAHPDVPHGRSDVRRNRWALLEAAAAALAQNHVRLGAPMDITEDRLAGIPANDGEGRNSGRPDGVFCHVRTAA